MNRIANNFLHLIIIALGLGVILGTILKTTNIKNFIYNSEINPPIKSNLTKLTSKNEIKTLSKSWEDINKRNNEFDISAFIYFIDDNKFAQLNSETILPSTGTIKLPIIFIILQMLDEKKIKWEEPLKIEPKSFVKGSNLKADKKSNQVLPLNEIIDRMNGMSKNAATNILIKRIGGINELNKRIQLIGLKKTKFENILTDSYDQHTTTTKDLVKLISLTISNEILSIKSRDLFKEIMSQSKNNSVIPVGLLLGLKGDDSDINFQLKEKGYEIYNQTGETGRFFADAALIEMPDESKAIAAFIVKSPSNVQRSREIIRQLVVTATPFLTPPPSSQ